MDDAAPASPATPTTAATAGTEGSPLKRRLSALLLSDGKGGKAAAAAAASPLYLEPGRMERLLSSEFGEDVVQLCEMIAATGAKGAVYGGGNPPPLTPTPGSGSSPPPPRRRLLHGDDDEDGESEGPGAAGAGGRGLPPPSTSREGAGSCASEDGSDDDDDEEGGSQATGAGQLDAVRRGLLQLQTPPRQRDRKGSSLGSGVWAPATAAAADRQPPPQPHLTSTQSSPARRVSIILDSEGGKAAATATAAFAAATTAAAATVAAVRPPSTPPLGSAGVGTYYQTPPRAASLSASASLSLSSSRPSSGAAIMGAGAEEDDGQVRLFHHAIRRRQEAVAIHILRSSRQHASSAGAARLATSRDPQGRTALMLAARHNLPSLLHLLLAPTATAAVGPPQLDPRAASKQGHYALCYAAMGGHIDCLALLLTSAAGGSPHNYQQALQSQSAPCGHSPLHHAVKYLHLKAARWLVGRGAGINARIRPSPSLYHARGARVRTPRQLEEERATALHCAVRVYLRVKEEQQLLKLAGVGAVAAAARAARAEEGEGEDGEEEEDGLGGVLRRVGMGVMDCKAGLKEREERAFKLIRWLVEEGKADLLARDARGRTALDVVMASPLYQRPTLGGMASSSSVLLANNSSGGSPHPYGSGNGANSLENTPTRPTRGLGLRSLSLSSAASDPGVVGAGGGRIKRSLSITSLFSLSSFRARVRGRNRSGNDEAAAAVAAGPTTPVAGAGAATPAAVPLMGRGISGAGTSSMSLAGLTAALASATSVRRVAKYLALMQRKQRAVDAAFGELFDVNNLRI